MARTLARCTKCKVMLGIPGFPSTGSRGGDCVLCTAEAGDPACIRAILREFRTRRDKSVVMGLSQSVGDKT